MIQKLFIAILALQTLTFGETLSVKVIDARTGGGVPGREVQLQLWDVHSGRYEMRDMLRANTDQNGVAAFHLPVPLPHDVIAMLNFGNWARCAFAERHSTDNVLLHGAVEGASCGEKNIQVHPDPGMLYLFARPRTFWESLKRIP